MHKVKHKLTLKQSCQQYPSQQKTDIIIIQYAQQTVLIYRQNS